VQVKKITGIADGKDVSCRGGENNTSVNADANRARTRLQQLSKESTGRLGKRTWSREELHDR
jgi:hypothetical protein